MSYIIRTQDLELIKKTLKNNNKIINSHPKSIESMKQLNVNEKLIKFLELNYYI